MQRYLLTDGCLAEFADVVATEREVNSLGSALDRLTFDSRREPPDAEAHEGTLKRGYFGQASIARIARSKSDIATAPLQKGIL